MFDLVNDYIEAFDKKLILSLDKTNYSFDLANGKMGFCIYFFVTGKLNNNKQKLAIGKKLIKEICQNANTIQSIDLKSGLAGIGLGIRYLITRKYVTGNVNVILSDIDDLLFKRLSYPDSYGNKDMDSISLIHILYYLCLRLNDQLPASESEYLYQELIIQTFNQLYEKVDVDFLEDPLIYMIDYRIPLFLLLLNKIYHLNFYNARILQILNEISYKIVSIVPILHANRLFLIWGMNSVKEIVNSKIRWNEHINLLRNNLNINSIFNNELMSKNIFLQDGVSSIYFISKAVSDFFSEQEFIFIKQFIFSKIESFDWEKLKKDDHYFNFYSSLLNGFCMIPILYLLENNKLLL